MQISSKVETKKYFLPVYLVWAILIPTVLVLLNAYLKLSDEGTVFNNINWARVPALFALYGFVWPLTIVTFNGFYMAFTSELGFEDFWAAKDSLGDVDEDIALKAKRSVIMVLWLTVIWAGPVIHLILAFIFHKRLVDRKNDTVQKWIDYLYGFI